MTPLTKDEERQALEALLVQARQQVAQLAWTLKVHREILKSPADHLAALEKQSLDAVRVAESLEAWR